LKDTRRYALREASRRLGLVALEVRITPKESLAKYEGERQTVTGSAFVPPQTEGVFSK